MKIGVIGSRKLTGEHEEKVYGVVKYLVDKGYKIHSGGALGADQFALSSLLKLKATKKGVIFSAWSTPVGFPKDVRKSINEFLINGGKIVWLDAYSCPNPPVIPEQNRHPFLNETRQ